MVEIESLYKPRIMITGVSGGTGASTTAKELHKLTDQPIISGGKDFRGLAKEFALYRAQHPDQEPDAQYLEFLGIFNELYRQVGFIGVIRSIQESIQIGANGVDLGIFEGAIEHNFEKNKKVDAVWDYVVDQHTFYEALRMPGFIWESKLAVLALHLDQLQTAIPDKAALAFPYMNVLLTLDPKIAAERIGQREHRQVNEEEVKIRKKRVFNRFKSIYQILGRDVKYDDLRIFSDVQISTEFMTPDQVAEVILIEYMKKVTTTHQHPFYAFPLIQNLNESLSKIPQDIMATG